VVGSGDPTAGSAGGPLRPPRVINKHYRRNVKALPARPGGLQKRPKASRRPPGVSQSVLEHPGSLQECLPGVSWTLPGSQKALVSSIQRLLDGSDNFVVSLKLFPSVLECFGSLRKRLRASWSVSEVSRDVSEHLPAGSWRPSKLQNDVVQINFALVLQLELSGDPHDQNAVVTKVHEQ